MSAKAEFYQNAFLCLATVGTLGLWATKLINEETFDSLKGSMNVSFGFAKFALFMSSWTPLVASVPIIHQNNLNKKKRWNELVNSIGNDVAPENNRKNIPKVS